MTDAYANPSPAGWTIAQGILPDDRLRQGDLVAFQNLDPLRRYGLVVTADCDLDQRKHARLITMVPVVTLREIVEYYLLPEICDGSRQIFATYVGKKLNISGDPSSPENTAALRVHLQKPRQSELSSAQRLAVQVLLNEHDRVTVDEFVEVMVLIGSKVGNLAHRLESKVRSKGDLLVLPSIRDLGVDENIAWVRHIWQVPQRDIVFRTSEVRENNGQRVARLDSPFRYRITQLMAQVFSDIGLPNVEDSVSSDLTLMIKEK